MGYDRHDLNHRLSVRPRADLAALASAARRLGLARPLRVWAAGWARRALHPLAHPRNPRVSQCRKTAADADQRVAAPTAGLGAAGARRRRDLEQLLLPAALYPDLRRQDAASARLYHLRRYAGRGHHPRRLLGHCWHYSDRSKPRTQLMLITAWLFLLAAYPSFWLMVTFPSLATAVFAVGFLNLIKA